MRVECYGLGEVSRQNIFIETKRSAASFAQCLYHIYQHVADNQIAANEQCSNTTQDSYCIP